MIEFRICGGSYDLMVGASCHESKLNSSISINYLNDLFISNEVLGTVISLGIILKQIKNNYESTIKSVTVNTVMK